MRRVVVKIVSVLLTISLAIACCSCHVGRGFTGINQGLMINEQEIIRIMLSAVANENNLNEAYTSIPEEQHGGVSISYFKAYIDVIRKLSRSYGTIDSFRILTNSELDSLLESYVEGSELTREYFDTYGDLVCAEIIFSKEAANPVYIFLTRDSLGNPILCSDWITDTLDVYNYADHYFAMLDEQNVDGVFTIIKPSYDENVYSDSVIRAKAERLIDYYIFNIRSIKAQYEYRRLSPVGLDIRIPAAVDQFSDSVIEHLLSVKVNVDGNCYVEDTLSEVFDSSISYVYSDVRLVHLGNFYSTYSLSRIMGRAQHTDAFELDGIKKVLTIYPGMVLVFDVSDNSDEAMWDGMLTSIRLYGNQYSIGPNIRVGMTIDELMTCYPFLDEVNFEIRCSNGASDAIVTYDVEDDVITNVYLKEVA